MSDTYSEIKAIVIDLIVAEEVSSRDYYVAHYQHPEWPGGASGVTTASAISGITVYSAKVEVPM